MFDFKDLKAQFDAQTNDDKAMIVIVSLIAMILGIAVLSLFLVLLKELFVPALIGLAIYFVGVKRFGWKVPSFVKKFYK